MLKVTSKQINKNSGILDWRKKETQPLKEKKPNRFFTPLEMATNLNVSLQELPRLVKLKVIRPLKGFNGNTFYTLNPSAPSTNPEEIEWKGLV